MIFINNFHLIFKADISFNPWYELYKTPRGNTAKQYRRLLTNQLLLAFTKRMHATGGKLFWVEHDEFTSSSVTYYYSETVYQIKNTQCLPGTWSEFILVAIN